MALFKKKQVSTESPKENEPIDLESIDRESRFKNYTGTSALALQVVFCCFSIFQLYASITNSVPTQILRYTHLGFAICLAYLIYPTSAKSDRDKHSIIDVILALGFFSVVAYFVFNYMPLQFRAGAYTQADIIMAGIGIALVLLACWRVVGPPLVIIASVFFLYGLAGPYLPGFLHHRGYSLSRIITHLFITTEGIIGSPLGVSSTYIFLFILFGAFLEKTGIGQFFIDLANAIAGGYSGGPAKVAVLSSALQGTISGSSVSNTVSTGSFTIPMMKKMGYDADFAGAVEAAASTGGQIMPPVMGSAAFLIADAVGISYRDLMVTAIVPALLYFIGIGIMVHFEAKRKGLKGMPKDQLPRLGPLFMKRGHLFLPLVAIIFFMLTGYTITRSALYGIAIAALIPYIRKGTRIPVKQVLSALPQAGKSVVSVATACSTAGVIIGMVTLTGLGQRIGSGIFELVGSNVFLALVCAMLTSLILGMGVSTTSNYLITSTIAAPILIRAGIPILAAHMFCFYFGIIADITPPVALAAYAGSAIAGGNAFKTGVNAAKLAAGAFLVPYMFALNPKMIFIGGTFWDALPMIITAIVGICGIGGGLIGYINGPVKSYWRIVLAMGGLCLLIPGTLTDIIGTVLVVGVMMLNAFVFNKKETIAS